MPAHARVRAAAGGDDGRPGSDPGPGPGPSLSSGSGSGSLPGLVLFESGLRVWVASIPLRYPDPNRTRSAIQIRTAPRLLE